MPVSLRLLDATAAGAQTLRLVTALVCSISVTTAVAGPMAYQAIEFRRANDDSAAAIAEPTQVVERGVLSSGAFAAPPAPSAARGPLEASTTVVSPTSTSFAGTTTTTGGGPGAPDAPFQPSAVGPSSSPVATEVPPQVFISVPPEPAVEPAAVTPPTSPAAPPTVAPTTTASQTDLSEFNPHPSCDDKAQELNVGTRLVCPSSPSAP